MEFRDLKKQYTVLKSEIDKQISETISSGRFIGGNKVKELENTLADYVGMKHCVSCANGTDALELALRVWGIGEGDAVLVPDFTFFSSGEVVSAIGATPVFVDVDSNTCNIDPQKLEKMIIKIKAEGEITPKVIIAVDLFGLPANYGEIRKIADKYSLKILEDGAQGFGGEIKGKKACSFGDMSSTSFFPAKPLGCYGDGGAVFSNNDEEEALLRSYCVHGKGEMKYDNVRIGMNSRLDSLQAGILIAKFNALKEFEIININKAAELYTEKLNGLVKTPNIDKDYLSSWAQYTIQLESKEARDKLQDSLKKKSIPSMIYYPKPMHKQQAFNQDLYNEEDYPITNRLCDTVLALPIHPYITEEDITHVVDVIKENVNVTGAINE